MFMCYCKNGESLRVKHDKTSRRFCQWKQNYAENHAHLGQYQCKCVATFNNLVLNWHDKVNC